MKHMVITIGCEYGAGGPEIGKMLAQALGIEYYDRDLVDKIVNDLDVDKELVEKADKATNVISLQYQAMHKMAEKSSCVIIGRSANYLLHDRDDLINIFIYAPEEDRIRAVMEHQSVSEAKAREIISYNDERNRSRHQYITGTNRGDRSQRDLLINSSMLGWEKTCQYLLLLVEMMNE